MALLQQRFYTSLKRLEIANHTGNKEILDYLVSQGTQLTPTVHKNYKVVVRETLK